MGPDESSVGNKDSQAKEDEDRDSDSGASTDYSNLD